MWRLTQLHEQRDRGATMITFALLLTVIFAFIGLGVDGAVFYAKKQEAQNGADAAALAIAQEYAPSSTSGHCTEDYGMATNYAQQNATWGETGFVAESVDCSTKGKVTVEVDGTFTPFFSQVVGVNDLTASGAATVEWGAPYTGSPMLPITFSVCDFNAWDGASGAPVTLYQPKHSDTPCNWGPSGNVMPAGFGYLGDGCQTLLTVNGWVESQNGNTPKNCDANVLRSYVGKTILLPIFDQCRTGQTGVTNCKHDPSISPSVRQYHIYAFAAWRLDSFFFSNSYRGGTPQPCSQPQVCVRGSFVKWVDLGTEFELGPAPATHSVIIRFAG